VGIDRPLTVRGQTGRSNAGGSQMASYDVTSPSNRATATWSGDDLSDRRAPRHVHVQAQLTINAIRVEI